MGIVHIMERGGSDYREYKDALKKLKEAKRAIDTICELTEDMESEYGERGSVRMRDGYYRRGDSEEMEERRSYGRYR